MDRGAWWATVHRGHTKSQTRLKQLGLDACYTVRPCCLSILHIIVCSCWSQRPVHPSPAPPLGNHRSVLYVCESFSVPLCHILFIYYLWLCWVLGFLGGASGKEPSCQCRRHKRWRFDPWVRKTPWRRKWQLTPVFLPAESHGQKSLAGCSPCSHKESDTAGWLSTQG